MTARLAMNKIILPLILGLIIAVNAACGYHMHGLAAKRTQLKEDYTEVNSFKYGLLSIDGWKNIVQKIVTDRVTEFKLTEDQQKILHQEITTMLKALMAEANDILKKPQGGLAENIKNRFARSYIKSARKNAPRFAKAISRELQKPSNMQKLKDMALQQFNSYAAQTHSSEDDVANLKRLLAKNNAQNIEEYNAASEKNIIELDKDTYRYTFVLMGSTLLFLFLWWALRQKNDVHRMFFGFSVAFAFVLLLTSMSMPMMEVDARLNSVDFTLLGEKLHFNDQVLYYRSKSLMQMVRVLLNSGKADSFGVGLLIFLFSIMFPLSKLICAELYLLGGEKIRGSKIVQFFAFNSGKWSMADVYAVAIFMAYIGFESIINTQLRNLDVSTPAFQSVSTDASAMQPGFVLFATFVLYGLALSEILKHITPKDRRKADGKIRPVVPRPPNLAVVG